MTRFVTGSRVSNICHTRSPRGADSGDDIRRDPEAVAAHLEDAAHYPGGHAAGVFYPRSETAIARLLQTGARVLPVGAQSSLTGGATPFGEVLLSTRHLSGIGVVAGSRISVQAGVTLDDLQAALGGRALYPPTPTFTGATAGGCVATNAAGAATFKYGCTRHWVEALTVVLASGEVLELHRDECRADETGFAVRGARATVRVPVCPYRMPEVAKRSAGYFAAPGMDLVDLFVGSEGTLGIITEVTFRVLSPAPALALALVFCRSEQVGIDLVSQLRRESINTWEHRDPAGIDACAIEYLDDCSLALVRSQGDLRQLGVTVPDGAALALLVQLELPPGTTSAATYDQVGSALLPGAPRTGLVRFCESLERHGVLDLTELTAPGDWQRQQQLLGFREAVPARVNQLVRAAKRDVDPRIEKTAADMIVPFERFGEMLGIYREGFERRGLDFAIWGHISDGNVHPNVIPHSYEDVLKGKEAILAFGQDVSRLGGCPLAEHGVGRNPVKQALLRQLYGDSGVEAMRAVKRALDPEWKLAPGVMFPG